jgi:precorrin-6B methylase 2
MVPSRFVRQLLFVLYLSMIVAGVFAQAVASAEFEPTVGQEGKDVIWVPTPQALVNKMLDMANVTPQDFVIDLGSGDGRTVITAAKRGVRAMGIEYEPNMVELSKRNAAREGVADKTQFIQADLFESDFSQATVITMFLLEEINLKLRPRLLDLKPGTRVVSNAFTMGEWTADETVTLEENKDCGVYCTALLWIVPAKVEGTWKLPQGELTVTQIFQTFFGTLKSGPNSMSVLDGKLSGDRIRFSVGEANYSGQVSGGTMQGTFTPGGSTAPWNAVRAK